MGNGVKQCRVNNSKIYKILVKSNPHGDLSVSATSIEVIDGQRSVEDKSKILRTYHTLTLSHELGTQQDSPCEGHS